MKISKKQKAVLKTLRLILHVHTCQQVNRCVYNCPCRNYAAAVFDRDQCRVALVAGVNISCVFASHRYSSSGGPCDVARDFQRNM